MLIYSIDIWPARNSRVKTRKTNYLVRKRVCLVLPYWTLARTTIYRPICKASALCYMLSKLYFIMVPYLKETEFFEIRKSFLRLHSFASFVPFLAKSEKMIDNGSGSDRFCCFSRINNLFCQLQFQHG